MAYRHIPVMREEVLAYLNCSPGNVIVDGTLGGCGHAGAIFEQIVPGGLLIGIDQDPEAIRHAEAIFKGRGDNVRLFHDDFANLPDILSDLAISGADGILLDLGLSLYQLEASGRGFSFRREEPLDMRMDTESKTMAADLIQQADEKELARIFKEYGEERWANRIARAVVQRRRKRPIATAQDLSQIVAGAIPKAGAGSRIHPATRVFMALRIVVNRELERLEAFMDNAPDLLNTGGRLCVLSFHSLEDRIVKHRLKQHAAGCTCPPGLPVCTCNHQPTLRILTRKAVTPSPGEVHANPMARSTRLRAAEKLIWPGKTESP